MSTKTKRIVAIGSTLALLGVTVWYFQSANGTGAQTDTRQSPSRDGSGAHKYTNRLVHSKPPYLLQHAHNPVDWYEWGEEAFAKARAENKPILLSVGYSTCHWCHVMERESFENAGIAKTMNEHFVNIKADREERPDVDGVYMTFVQATTGGGGWPMSVWLTPGLDPIFGGTYFPPEDRWGRRGFPSILEMIAKAWQNDREEILASGADVTRRLRQYTRVEGSGTGELEKAWLDTTYEQIKSSYEPRYGGFGGAPKFPRPVSLNFMLRHYARTGVEDALEMSHFTLRKMAEGGMHDHLGGGFHRYSVDDRWHVPHFEKMLYDQAQLVCSYLEVYQITGEEPSPNSVAVLNLLRLGEMLDQQEFRAMAERTLAAFGPRLDQAPSAMPQMMVAFEFHLSKPTQIIIAGQPGAEDTRAMLEAVHDEFIPNKILLLADGARRQEFLGKHLDFIQGVTSTGGKATAYVFRNYICKLPTTDVSMMMSQLARTESDKP